MAEPGVEAPSTSTSEMNDVTSSVTVVEGGKYVRVKRRRDEAPLDDFVMTRRARRPTGRAAKRMNVDLLEGLQKLAISSDGQFAATEEDSFGIIRRQKFKRVGTLSVAELKNQVSAVRKLKKMMGEMDRPFRGKRVTEDIIPSYRIQSLIEIRRTASQNAMRDKLRERRDANPFLKNKDEIIANLMERFKEKERKSKPTTSELLFRAYCGNEMLPEERRSLREMHPYLHEKYKELYNLTEEEAIAEEEEGEYVFDYYIRSQENGQQDDFETQYGVSEEDEDGSEDSNAENWFANDYPEEEDDEHDMDPFDENSQHSEVDSDSDDGMTFR